MRELFDSDMKARIYGTTITVDSVLDMPADVDAI
jgi:hypothetical protein